MVSGLIAFWNQLFNGFVFHQCFHDCNFAMTKEVTRYCTITATPRVNEQDILLMTDSWPWVVDDTFLTRYAMDGFFHDPPMIYQNQIVGLLVIPVVQQ